MRDLKQKWYGAYKMEKAKVDFDPLGRGVYIKINGKQYPIFKRYLINGERIDDTYYLHPAGEVIGKYEDGKIAVLKRKHGNGVLYLWGCNPFVSDTINENNWIEFWREVQKERGCKIDLPIWNFYLENIEN